MARITTNDTPSSNELSFALINNQAEVAIIEILLLRGGAWWMPNPMTMEGLGDSSRAFAWRDVVNNQKLVCSIPGVAPTLINEGGVRNYLRFGFGGALSPAANGALETPPGIDVWSGPSVSFFAVPRTPPAGGAAGASPGGAIVGNMLSQTDAFSPASNKTWTGLQMGYATNSAGEPRIAVMGDTVYTDIPGIQNYKDGKYKVLSGIFDAVGQTQEIRVNGVSQLKTTSQYGDPVTNAAVSTAAGARRIRVGATGAPGTSTLTNTLRADLRHVIVLGSAATPAEIATIENYLLSDSPLT